MGPELGGRNFQVMMKGDPTMGVLYGAEDLESRSKQSTQL